MDQGLLFVMPVHLVLLASCGKQLKTAIANWMPVLLLEEVVETGLDSAVMDPLVHIMLKLQQ